jgi:hypothetical protein
VAGSRKRFTTTRVSKSRLWPRVGVDVFGFLAHGLFERLTFRAGHAPGRLLECSNALITPGHEGRP